MFAIVVLANFDMTSSIMLCFFGTRAITYALNELNLSFTRTT